MSKPLEAPASGPLYLDDYEGVWIHRQDFDSLMDRVFQLCATTNSRALLEDLSGILIPVDEELDDRRAKLLPGDPPALDEEHEDDDDQEVGGEG